MYAKKVVFFLWGAAFASLWWARGALELPFEFWILVIFGTGLTSAAWIINTIQHWEDE